MVQYLTLSARYFLLIHYFPLVSVPEPVALASGSN